MTLPDINFRNIRKHRSSQNDGFEELTRQLVLAEPPENHASIENRGPGADGGVEILVKFPDDRVWGWQSKYFTNSFGASEVAQLRKSFSAALANFPTLERYHVAVPRNFSGYAEGENDTQTKNWNGFEKWCGDEAAKLGRAVSIELWDDSYFVSRLQRSDPIYAGMRLYWFDEKALDTEWFQAKLAKSLDYVGKRYRPDDHVEVGISNTIGVLRRDRSFENRVLHVSQSLAGATADLRSLIKRDDEIAPLREHCASLTELLDGLIGALTDCAHRDLYDRRLSEILSEVAVIVSAFPITYAARLDAVTKLHGISSSMRL